MLKRQLAGSVPDEATADNTVIAYEPVWAIGTGLTPTTSKTWRRSACSSCATNSSTRFGDDGASMRLLYGGSVKPGNAKELMGVAHVDGALIGGASLKAADLPRHLQGVSRNCWLNRRTGLGIRRHLL